MSEPTNAETLLTERNWIEGLLTLRAAVGDVGINLAAGQAEISYGRITGYWQLIIRPELALTAPVQRLDLAAHSIAARALLADFDRDMRRTSDQVLDFTYYAWRLAEHLRQLLEAIERKLS